MAMKCPSCGAECGEGKFCEECGYQFPQTKECPKCHAELSLNAKFCGECGYSFLGQSETGSKGSFVGDKNVIAGDVVGGSVDRRVYHGDVTNNNITTTTTNYINQDESRKVVHCHVCNKPLIITESFLCKKCGETICKNCFDDGTRLCLHCYEESQDGKARKLNDKIFALNQLKKYQEALEIGKTILDSGQELSKGLLASVNRNVGFSLYFINRDEWERASQRLAGDGPDENDLATIRQLVCRQQECIKYLEKAVELNPGDQLFSDDLASAQRQLSSYIETREAIEKKLSPEGQALSKAREMRAKADVLYNQQKYRDHLLFPP